jgi:glycosyltransferase involved in cell wall biosynthesis
VRPLRVAAFGFRSYPPEAGSAGADKFAQELLPRLARLGCKVTAYNRVYGVDVQRPKAKTVGGVEVISFRTTERSGFDTLFHSARVTYDIIRHNRADIVHIQNGGNSVFGAVLRLFGKKTFLSQDGLDWERDKWPWYAKLFLWLSSILTAHIHNAVIFDNVFARDAFTNRFKRNYDFIPFGADVNYTEDASALNRLGLEQGKYFLFVGRFIPDKGLHWLVSAFEKLNTDMKLVLVGGSPNPSNYEADIKSTVDPRIVFTGFLYGQDVHALMANAYAYVQPSSIEGLSPVILEAAYLGAPVICSDIPQNRYAIDKYGVYFRTGDVADLTAKLSGALEAPRDLAQIAASGSNYVATHFSWEAVVEQHLEVFRR